MLNLDNAPTPPTTRKPRPPGAPSMSRCWLAHWGRSAVPQMPASVTVRHRPWCFHRQRLAGVAGQEVVERVDHELRPLGYLHVRHPGQLLVTGCGDSLWDAGH